MKGKLFLLVPLILLYRCTHIDHSESNKKATRHNNVKSNAHTGQRDTLIIDKKEAVSVMLDSLTLEKRKKEWGDTAFYVGADDGNYYDYIADSVLEQKHLPMISADGYHYLKFVQNNGATTLIRIDTLSEITTLYFFDPSKPPHNSDVVNIEEEYKNYYKR